MSSHRHRQLSPVWSRGDIVDQLIYQALLEEVGEAAPSPQVWQNICRQIETAIESRPAGHRPQFLPFWRGLLVFLDLMIAEKSWEARSWEARLAERRPLLFWPNQVMLVV
ncbi:MAG: hypothetical protein ACOYZ7_09405 [Chloroflexota bacterium]